MISQRRRRRRKAPSPPLRPALDVEHRAQVDARQPVGVAERVDLDIFPPRTVKAITDSGRPFGATTTPAAPLTRAGRTHGASDAKVIARLATSAAPRTVIVCAGRRRPPSLCSTTSGSRTATSASKSPSCASHPAPRAARQLARCVGGPVDHGSDLAERHGEHVVQHERQPLGGGQLLEHHQHRQPDGVRQQRLVLRVNTFLKRHDRLRDAHVDGLLTPRLARPQGVHTGCSGRSRRRSCPIGRAAATPPTRFPARPLRDERRGTPGGWRAPLARVRSRRDDGRWHLSRGRRDRAPVPGCSGRDWRTTLQLRRERLSATQATVVGASS